MPSNEFALSIVTISFNQAPWLPAMLRSIEAGRRHATIEHIVVDAGSTDGSRGILSAAGRAIDKLILEPDRGPADGLNKGFAAASGTAVGYINADDMLIPDGVRAIRAAFTDRTKPDVLVGDGQLIDGEGRLIRRFRTARRPTTRSVALGAAVVLQQSTFFLRESLPRVPFNVDNRIAWDTELMLEMLARRASVRHTPAELGAFRIHAAGLTGSGSHWDKVRAEHRRMYERYVGAEWTRWQDGEYIARRVLKALGSTAREPSRVVRKIRTGGASSWQ